MDLLRLLGNPLKILCRFGWHNRLDPIYSTTCDMGAGLVRHREICPRCFTVLVDNSRHLDIRGSSWEEVYGEKQDRNDPEERP